MAFRDVYILMGNDKTIDYEYSIPELRGLIKICLKLKLGNTDEYRGYKKMLKQQEAAALRDWEKVQKAMERAKKTRQYRKVT